MSLGLRSGALTAEMMTEERRRESRASCFVSIDILPCAPGNEAWNFRSVELIDCSPDGLGIVSDTPMDVGEEFLVKLEADTTSLVLYVVRHCAPTSGRRYQIGAEFKTMAASPLFAEGRQAILEHLLGRAEQVE